MMQTLKTVLTENVQLDGTFITVIVVVIGIAVFGIQYLLGRLNAPKWTAAILPIAWIGLVIFIAINGYLSSFRDYLVPALGFFALLAFWGAGEERNKKLAKKQ